MTLFLILAVLTGRVTEWEHYPHYGGGQCIVSRNGTIMAGTSGGILFSHYSPSDDQLAADSGWTSPGELSWDRVSDIAFDSLGNMWISLSGGGIDMVDPDGGMTHFNQIDGLPLSLGVNQTIPDTVIYAATTQGLCIREFGYFEVWDTYETGGGLPGDNVNCILQADSGLFVGTAAGLVFLRSSSPPGDPDSWIPQQVDQTSIVDLQWSGDTLWAATAEKLFYLPPSSGWMEEITFPGGNIASLSTGDGPLAVGCTNRCYIRDGGQWVLYDTNLDGNALAGLTWFQGRLAGVLANTYSSNRASGSGLALLLPDSTWRRTFPDFGPVSNDLRACALGADGTVWVTSNRNGASAFHQDQWTNLNLYLTSRSQCFAVCPSGNGAFVSSLGFGMDWLDWESGEVVSTLHFTAEDGLANNRVFDCEPGGQGVVWFAHRTLFENEEGGVSRLSWTPGDPSTAVFRVISGASGLPSKEVNCVLAAGSRYAYAGTDEGVALIDGNTQSVDRVWGAGSGLPSLLVSAMAADRSGTVYAGTTGGLAVLSDQGAVPISGLASQVQSMAFDGMGSLWLGTSQGLRRYFPATGEIESYTSFNSPIPEATFYDFAIDSDQGFIWMATDHGFWRGTLESGLSGDGTDAKLYPNPFIPGEGQLLGISGVPDEPMDVTIFDLTGAAVFEYSSPGRDDFAWDGRTADGSPAASGVYMVAVQGETFTAPLLKFALVR